MNLEKYPTIAHRALTLNMKLKAICRRWYPVASFYREWGRATRRGTDEVLWQASGRLLTISPASGLNPGDLPSLHIASFYDLIYPFGVPLCSFHTAVWLARSSTWCIIQCLSPRVKLLNDDMAFIIFLSLPHSPLHNLKCLSTINIELSMSWKETNIIHDRVLGAVTDTWN